VRRQQLPRWSCPAGCPPGASDCGRVQFRRQCMPAAEEIARAEEKWWSEQSGGQPLGELRGPSGHIYGWRKQDALFIEQVREFLCHSPCTHRTFNLGSPPTCAMCRRRCCRAVGRAHVLQRSRRLFWLHGTGLSSLLTGSSLSGRCEETSFVEDQHGRAPTALAQITTQLDMWPAHDAGASDAAIVIVERVCRCTWRFAALPRLGPLTRCYPGG
jgi:hypothetical protein